ncbi:hypothetical protein GEMRC1_007722 [Eukaryota sp. GEM-RC1]
MMFLSTKRDVLVYILGSIFIVGLAFLNVKYFLLSLDLDLGIRSIFWEAGFVWAFVVSYGIAVLPATYASYAVLRLTIFFEGTPALVLLLLAVNHTFWTVFSALLVKNVLKADLRYPSSRDIIVYFIVVVFLPSITFWTTVLILTITFRTTVDLLAAWLTWQLHSVVGFFLINPIVLVLLIPLVDHFLLKYTDKLSTIIPPQYRTSPPHQCLACSSLGFKWMDFVIALVNLVYFSLLLWVTSLSERRYFFIGLIPFSFYFIYRGFYSALLWLFSTFLAVWLMFVIFGIIAGRVGLLMAIASGGLIVLISAIHMDTIKQAKKESTLMLQETVDARTAELRESEEKLAEAVRERSEFLLHIHARLQGNLTETYDALITLDTGDFSLTEQQLLNQTWWGLHQISLLVDDLKFVAELGHGHYETSREVMFCTIIDDVFDRCSNYFSCNNLRCFQTTSPVSCTVVLQVETARRLIEVLFRSYFLTKHSLDLHYHPCQEFSPSSLDNIHVLAGSSAAPLSAHFIDLELADSHEFAETLLGLEKLGREQQIEFASWLVIQTLCECVSSVVYVSPEKNVVIRLYVDKATILSHGDFLDVLQSNLIKGKRYLIVIGEDERVARFFSDYFSFHLELTTIDDCPDLYNSIIIIQEFFHMYDHLPQIILENQQLLNNCFFVGIRSPHYHYVSHPLTFHHVTSILSRKVDLPIISDCSLIIGAPSAESTVSLTRMLTGLNREVSVAESGDDAFRRFQLQLSQSKVVGLIFVLKELEEEELSNLFSCTRFVCAQKRLEYYPLMVFVDFDFRGSEDSVIVRSPLTLEKLKILYFQSFGFLE